MRIMVIGLRGIPAVQGGVECHAEHLYPLLIELGCEVEVIVRTPYHPIEKGSSWRGVQLRRLWAPKTSGLEALVHSLLATLYAVLRRPDVLHIHAVGPALMTPLARALGLRVVVTHHGPDYNREKWGRMARWILRTGEQLGMRFANQRIVISETISQLVWRRYGRQSVLIPNGVEVADLAVTKEALQEFGLTPRKYVLQVSRFVPEKRQLDLMQAFAQTHLPDWKLVLVGGLDQREAYTQKAMAVARDVPNVILAGFQGGQALRELYTHAGIFVLPSSHEGLPIALLEALSYGLSVLASDIAANLEVGLPTERYFRLGDVQDLSERLRNTAETNLDEGERQQIRAWVKERYDWKKIAGQTLDVYNEVMGLHPLAT